MTTGQQIVDFAKTLLGIKYVWGGTTTNGFDCSGLVQYVYKHFGFEISRTTKTQINDGREVGRNELQLGDLVFPSNGHVTLYVGNGQVLHAPYKGQVVKIEKLWAFWRARRILPPHDQHDHHHRHPSPPKLTFPIKTKLHPTGDEWEFLMGDYNHDGKLDLYCIKKRRTGSGKLEVHILSGKSGYQTWLLQTGTPHQEVDENTSFILGDYNHDGNLDLYCINKRGNGTGKIYLNILKASDCFRSWVMNTDTCVQEVGDNVDFAMGDFQGNGHPDIYGIIKRQNGWTGVFIIEGKTNYKTLLMDTSTSLISSINSKDWFFSITDYVGHGKVDLIGIHKRNTPYRSIEFKVLDGTHEKLFTSYLMDTGAKYPEVDENYSFCCNGQEIYIIKKHGANCTEIDLLQIGSL